MPAKNGQARQIDSTTPSQRCIPRLYAIALLLSIQHVSLVFKSSSHHVNIDVCRLVFLYHLNVTTTLLLTSKFVLFAPEKST